LSAVFNHQQELSWQLCALHCTATAFCFHTLYNIDPSHNLQLPALHLRDTSEFI